MEQTTLAEHGRPNKSVVEDLTLSKAMASFDRFLGEDPHIGSTRNFMVSTKGIFDSGDISVYKDDFTPETEEEPKKPKMSLMHHSGALEKMFQIDEDESTQEKLPSPPPSPTKKASYSPNRPSNKKHQSHSPTKPSSGKGLERSTNSNSNRTSSIGISTDLIPRKPRSHNDNLSRTEHGKQSKPRTRRDELSRSEHSTTGPKIRRDELYSRRRPTSTTKTGNQKTSAIVNLDSIMLAKSVVRRQNSRRSLVSEDGNSEENPRPRRTCTTRQRSRRSLVTDDSNLPAENPKRISGTRPSRQAASTSSSQTTRSRSQSVGRTRRARSKSASGSRVSQSRRNNQLLIVGGEVSTAKPRAPSASPTSSSLRKEISPKNKRSSKDTSQTGGGGGGGVKDLVHDLRRQSKVNSLAKFRDGNRNLMGDWEDFINGSF